MNSATGLGRWTDADWLWLRALADRDLDVPAEVIVAGGYPPEDLAVLLDAGLRVEVREDGKHWLRARQVLALIEQAAAQVAAANAALDAGEVVAE